MSLFMDYFLAAWAIAFTIPAAMFVINIVWWATGDKPPFFVDDTTQQSGSSDYDF